MNESTVFSPATQQLEKRTTWIVNILSIAIPLVVALLLGIRTKVDLGTWTKVLPHCIGAINTLTSICLVGGIVAQRLGKIGAHRVMMTSAFSLGGVFLVCYVTYHLSNESTRYGGEGIWRGVYYTVLISHILLSARRLRVRKPSGTVRTAEEFACLAMHAKRVAQPVMDVLTTVPAKLKELKKIIM